MSRKLGGVAAMLLLVLALAVSLGASTATGRDPRPRPRRRSCSRPTACARISWRSTRAGQHAHVQDADARTVSAGDNGLTQGFPPNTGVGWATRHRHVAGEHGSMNNTFHRLTTRASTTRRASSRPASSRPTRSPRRPSVRARRSSSVEWVGARATSPALQGPVVDFRTLLLEPRRPPELRPSRPAGRRERLRRRLPAGRPRPGEPAGRTCRTSFSPADAGAAHGHDDLRGRQRHRIYDLYIYDSTNDCATNYDHVLVVPRPPQERRERRRRPGQDDWADIKVDADRRARGPDCGLLREGVDLAPTCRISALYFTSIARVNATYNALGPPARPRSRRRSRHDFPTSTAADFAPLEAGIVDEDTYVEQGLSGRTPTSRTCTTSSRRSALEPDLLLLGNPSTDEFQHQFRARHAE